MKSIKILSITLALFLLGCSKNEEDSRSQSTLQGSWKLTRVVGGFAGVNQNFPPGDITWDFDLANQTVTVVNGHPDSGFSFFQSGTYPLVLSLTGESSDCHTTATIAITDLGCMYLNGNKLQFSQAASDGFELTLVR